MKKILYAVMLLLGLSIVGCQKEIPTELNVSPAEITFETVGGSQTISVTANKSWTVSSSAEWCKVSPAQGEANGTISVQCDKNEAYDGRNCTITIKSEELSKTITVKQNQADGLFVEQKEYEVSEEEQTLSIKVKSNIDYNVTVEGTCNWISVIRTKALSESTVKIKIEANDTKQREGKITIGNNNVYDVVTITQESATFVEFEDANFKAYCVKKFDKNRDGKISRIEALAVTYIVVDPNNISSLGGIEYFTNLESLICSLNYNHIINRNGIRYYYDGYGNEILGKITTLDVSKNTALTALHCDGNQLTTLDVSKNTALESLWCDNNQLTALDVSKNTALTDLLCYDNQLTALDVSKNTALTQLDCYGNQLTAFDVSKSTALTRLLCHDNQLSTLDVSNSTALTSLSCHDNQLTTLDVSKNTALVDLSCSDNQLTTLDVSKNTALKSLWCDNNQLTALDVSKNTALTRLLCYDNQLTALDVSKNTALTQLVCSGNQISTIYVWEGFDASKYPYFTKDDSATYVEVGDNGGNIENYNVVNPWN